MSRPRNGNDPGLGACKLPASKPRILDVQSLCRSGRLWIHDLVSDGSPAQIGASLGGFTG